MKGADPAILTIVRALKPYRGGNELLRAMHDLDIGDKHIAVMQVGSSGVTSALPMRQVGYERIPGDRPNRITFKADFGALKTIPIDLTGFPADPGNIETIGMLANSEVSLVIANGLPLETQSAIKVLNEMGNLAESIVKTFETHCLGGQKPGP